jgi:hypothetical protein
MPLLIDAVLRSGEFTTTWPGGLMNELGDRLLFRPAILFRRPFRKPELRFLCVSDVKDGVSKPWAERPDLIEDCVLGRCSLDEQDVGAVDWDSSEECLLESDSIVVAESEDIMPSISALIGGSSIPRDSASDCKASSRSSSVIGGDR